MLHRKSPVALSLIRNSKAAMLAAIEIHNKPLFPYRYEICTLLVINAWELLLKAYIHKFHKKVKIFRKDGTTKDFKECLKFVASNSGNEFRVIKESLERLYDYRNNVAHFYCCHLDVILFALLKANINFYNTFLKDKFRIELTKVDDLILLPIGLSKLYSPLDFLCDQTSLSKASDEVKLFIKSIIDSAKTLTDAGIEESILIDYRMNVTNEARIKNADIIAGVNNADPQANNIVIQNVLADIRISSDPSAKEIRISEDDTFSFVYTEQYHDVTHNARKRYSDFVQNGRFNKIMAKIKQNSALHRSRYLDPGNTKSAKKPFFSKEVYDELDKHYTIRIIPDDSD